MGTATKLAAALGVAIALGAAALLLGRAPRVPSRVPRPETPAAETLLLDPGNTGESAGRLVSGDRDAADAGPEWLTTGDAELVRTTLELQVVRPTGVALGLEAWLVAGFLRELPADLRALPEGVAPVRAAAEPDGVVRFTDLAPGPYRAALELDGLRLEQGVRLLEGQRTARIVVRLGAASVEGFVYDGAGLPAAGALVRLCRPGYGRNPPPHECFARADQNGFYRIQAVGSGLQAIDAHPDGELAGGDARREFLAPFTGVVRLDFGTPAFAGVVWRGTLRTASGEALPGPGEIRCRAEGTGMVRTEPLQDDGSFEVRLAPGRHHVWVRPASRFPELVDLGLQEVATTDFERELVLPGARLCLRLARAPGLDAAFVPVLRARDEPSPRALVVLADGALVRDGLLPGDYVLDARPHTFAESGTSSFSFSLGPGQDRLALELSLMAP